MCLEVSVLGRVIANRPGMPVVSRDDVMADDALAKALALQAEAAGLGFDWPDISGVLEKLQEEIAELREALKAGDAAQARREFGDLMFSVVNVSRFVEASPTEELEAASRRFQRRFDGLKLKLEAEGRAIRECTLQELDDVWEQVKTELGSAGGSKVV